MAQVATFCAPIVSPTESARVIFRFTPTISDVMQVRAIAPGGAEIDLSSRIRAVTASGSGLVSYYVMDFTPGIVGDWYIDIVETFAGDWGACLISVRAWAGNMDKPVSDVLKQRVDIDRLRTNIRNQGGR
jgi:hypothetical protein